MKLPLLPQRDKQKIMKIKYLIPALLSAVSSASVLADELPVVNYQYSAGQKFVSGTAVDPDHSGTVRLGAWIDGTSVGTVYASGGNFTFNIPSQYWDGQPHSLFLHAVDIDANGVAQSSRLNTVGPISLVVYPKPTATLYWSPSTVKSGQSATLHWGSNHADNCYIGEQLRPTSGAWVGFNRTYNQTVNMYCTGPGGTSNTVSTTLNVTPANTAPSVNLSVGASYDTAQEIVVSAAASDNDGTITHVEFVLLDGSGSQTLASATDTSAPYSHNFGQRAVGNYEVMAKAVDNDGAQTEARASVRVDEPVPPLAFNNLSYSPNPASIGERQTFSFDYQNAVKCWMDPAKNSRWSTEVVYVESTNGKGVSGVHSWESTPRTVADSWTQTVSCLGEDGTRKDLTVTNVIQASENAAPVVSVFSAPESVLVNEVITLTASGHDSDGTIATVTFTLVNTVTGDVIETLTGALNAQGQYVATTQLPVGNYSARVTMQDNQGKNSESQGAIRGLAVLPLLTPKVTQFSYFPNPAAINEAQTLQLSYENVYSCWASQLLNTHATASVTYLEDTGVLQTGTVTIDVPSSDSAQAWVQTVECRGTDGVIIQAETQNTIVDNDAETAPVAISNLQYYPKSVFVGERQTFSFTYENAKRCWMDADKNPRWSSDVTYVKDNGTIRSGEFSVESSIRTQEDAWTQTVSCEGADGTVVDTSFYTQVLTGIDLANLNFAPNNPAVVGEEQYLEFDYVNVSKCYAFAASNADLTQDVVYFDFGSANQSGTYQSELFTIDEPREYTRHVTCENTLGQTAELDAVNKIEQGDVSVLNLSWLPVQGAEAYKITIHGSESNTVFEETSNITALSTSLADGEYALNVNACISSALGSGTQYQCEGVSETLNVIFNIRYSEVHAVTGDFISSLLSSSIADKVLSGSDFEVSFQPSSQLLSLITKVEFKLSNGQWIEATLIDGVYLFDFGQLPQGSYEVIIRITDNAGNTYQSNHDVEAIEEAPTPVTNLTFTNVETQKGELTLTWEGSPLASEYRITESKNGVDTPIIVTTSLTEHTYLNKGQGSYMFMVQACNQFGCSTPTYSAELALSGLTVTYSYDALGRLKQVIDPSKKDKQYQYDAAGNRIAVEEQ